MVILLFAKFDLPPRLVRVGFAWCGLEPLASWCVILYVGQEAGLRARE
jgi:phage shock protein PspC (stress-responsive transcriptional regulator)